MSGRGYAITMRKLCFLVVAWNCTYYITWLCMILMRWGTPRLHCCVIYVHCMSCPDLHLLKLLWHRSIGFSENSKSFPQICILNPRCSLKQTYTTNLTLTGCSMTEFTCWMVAVYPCTFAVTERPNAWTKVTSLAAEFWIIRMATTSWLCRRLGMGKWMWQYQLKFKMLSTSMRLQIELLGNLSLNERFLTRDWSTSTSKKTANWTSSARKRLIVCGFHTLFLKMWQKRLIGLSSDIKESTGSSRTPKSQRWSQTLPTQTMSICIEEKTSGQK